MVTSILSSLVGALLFLLAIHAFPAEGQIIGPQELRSYLRAFGYLSNSSADSNAAVGFDEQLVAALKLFQKNYQLNVTGQLDASTIELIETPRCGVPDIINGSNSVNAGVHMNYVFEGNLKWPSTKHRLTYTFVSGAQSKVGPYALMMACRQAFALWAKASKFTFQEVGPGSPTDLRISFQRRDHGDGSPFDGSGKVVAHAFPPTDGRFHADADENWSFRPPSKNQLDLVWVATHEIGHLLGLGHSLIQDAVMFAYVSPGKVRRALHNNDIAGIQALYSHP